MARAKFFAKKSLFLVFNNFAVNLYDREGTLNQLSLFL